MSKFTSAEALKIIKNCITPSGKAYISKKLLNIGLQLTSDKGEFTLKYDSETLIVTKSEKMVNLAIEVFVSGYLNAKHH